jgi:mRNA-degrading endonuclease RelE of RelBE toxin-antitoxin system
MQFRISDTFQDSLAKLTGDEQKASKTAAFDLQLNPANPGLQFHKLDRARDKKFWSIRVNRDIRIIVHRTDSSLLLCYVDHHDKAYSWAERRKLERHPKTGAAQLVEVRETVREIQVPSYVVSEPKPKPALLAHLTQDELLGYGVPEEWIEDIKSADEDGILTIADRLPAEAAEAVLTLATGGTPQVPVPLGEDEDPFDHPDAKRRFRLLASSDELQQALEYPWEKWTVFLHPDQLKLVEKNYSGPARVAGSAGTGKTVVAIHRAVYLAKKDKSAKILLTTFSKPLAESLKSKLHCLVGTESDIRSRIVVSPIGDCAIDIYSDKFGEPNIANDAQVQSAIDDASEQVKGHNLKPKFLLAEWSEVVDAWHLHTWEAYRDVKRLGRKTRLAEPQRKLAWEIFKATREQLKAKNLVTLHDIYSSIVGEVVDGQPAPFSNIVIDEAQDISVSQLRFVSAIVSKSAGNLFFAGDLGQRIFQTPFSWKSLGVDVRGRSHTLRINYRTSHQIRAQADLLLPPEIADVDGNRESRRKTVSAFTGPDPSLQTFPTEVEESGAVANWLKQLVTDGVNPREIGIAVRTELQFERAEKAVKEAGLSVGVHGEASRNSVSIITMHQAKGLEFKCVAVMCCDDNLIPLESRIVSVSDQGDLEDVYNTERHLLYVACTRARDQLLITGVMPASEFLDDMAM